MSEKRSPEILHLIVTGLDGKIVHREVIENKYSSDSNYNRAVISMFNRLEEDFPEPFQINLILSSSDSPIALNSTT